MKYKPLFLGKYGLLLGGPESNSSSVPDNLVMKGW